MGWIQFRFPSVGSFGLRKLTGCVLGVKMDRMWRVPLNMSGVVGGRSVVARRFYSSASSSDGGDDAGVSAEEPGSLVPLFREDRDSSVRRKGVPDHVPDVLCIPVLKRPLIPGFYKTIYIQDPAVISKLYSLIKKGTPYIGAFLARSDTYSQDTVSSLADIHTHGTFCSIVNILPMTSKRSNENEEFEIPSEETRSEDGGGGVTLIVYPHRRIKAVDLDGSTVHTDLVSELPFDRRSPIIKALCQEIFVVLADIAKLSLFFREHLSHHGMAASIAESPSALADFIAVLSSSGEPSELQSVLSSEDVEERLRISLVLLKKEAVTAQLQASIRKDVESKINQRQREHVLYEQLKVIKKELGLETDSKEKILDAFRSKIDRIKENLDTTSPNTQEEMGKLSVLETAGTEFNLTRNYLDWLTCIPWTISTKDSFGIAEAQRILDTDHYGLKDVKERILEAIAVGSLRGTVGGKIVCLVGPPGVGKTSIGKSISKALGRKYFRFSVGGLGDVSELKGHRRTYVGAMPGKIVQALKTAGANNPVILIDEIDKVGRGGHQGDPFSALLEVLDPEQNFSFLDHYLDVPIDLSRVLFVCTANGTENIPGPLLDRMEIINLSGYTQHEKVHIARKHLIPQILKDTGLDGRIEVTDGALNGLLSGWSRENGVRSLKQHIEKMFRKVALDIVRDGSKDQGSGTENDVEKTRCVLGEGDLIRYLGQPIFKRDELWGDLRICALPTGVSMGLAWTSVGGAVLFIETVRINDGSTGLLRTGQLGKVMEESVSIAFSVARLVLAEKKPGKEVGNGIHLHVPEGATPKDGPSAGITMAASILSQLLGAPLASNLAMTGELTLSGKVLRIGGLKEKVIAAKREGVTRIIFPHGNLGEWDEISSEVTEGMEALPVSTFDQVYDICFGYLDRN